MVRLAMDSDIQRISLSYARAFCDDPVWRWLIPSDDFIGRMMISDWRSAWYPPRDSLHYR